jgi:hypothetical protein
MKLNVDATIFKNLRRVAVAAVAQDKEDDFLGASGVVIDGLTDAKTSETIACREDIALAYDLSLGPFGWLPTAPMS